MNLKSALLMLAGSVLSFGFQTEVAFAATAASIAVPQVQVDSTSTSVSFNYTGSAQYLRVFIDTDQNANTGLRVSAAGGAVIGADHLLNNSTLLRYTGNGTTFDWAPTATVTFSKSASSAQWTFPKSLIGSPLALKLVGDIAVPDYATSSAANYTYQQNAPVQISRPDVTSDIDKVALSFTYSGSAQYLRVFVDSDANNNTGLKVKSSDGQILGADYLINNSSFLRYIGNGTSFDWTAQQTLEFSKTTSSARWSLPRSLFGSASKLILVGDIAVPDYATSTLLTHILYQAPLPTPAPTPSDSTPSPILAPVLPLPSTCCGTYKISDFGAKGDGVTDDAPAFRAAFAAIATAGGGTLQIPDTGKSYLMGSWDPTPHDGLLFVAYLPSNLTMAGNGTLRMKDRIYPYATNGSNGVYYGVQLFGSKNSSNIFVDGLNFDMNGENNPQPANSFTHIMNTFRLYQGQNIVFQNITVKNSPGHNMIVFTTSWGPGTGAEIRNSKFLVGGRGVPGNQLNQDFSFLYSEWNHTKVLGNVIRNSSTNNGPSGGFEIHGSHALVRGNVIDYCDPGLWIASAPSAVDNVLIDSNIITNATRGIAFWRGKSALSNIKILNNQIDLKFNPTFYFLYGPFEDSGGIVMPFAGAYNNMNYTEAVAAGSLSKNITIKGNRITGTNGPIPYNTQPGILMHSVENVLVVDNTIRNVGSNGIQVLGSPFGNKNLVITRNEIKDFGRNSTGLGQEGIAVYGNGSPFSSRTDNFVTNHVLIFKNTIAQSTASRAAGGSFQSKPGQIISLLFGSNSFVNLSQMYTGSIVLDDGSSFRTPIETVGTRPATCVDGDLNWSSVVDFLDGWICHNGAWQRFGPQ